MDRRGAGRPALSKGKKLVNFGVRLEPRLLKWVKENGGSKLIRDLVRTEHYLRRHRTNKPEFLHECSCPYCKKKLGVFAPDDLIPFDIPVCPGCVGVANENERSHNAKED